MRLMQPALFLFESLTEPTRLSGRVLTLGSGAPLLPLSLTNRPHERR
jgi:tRNA1(Val) A37 N6-methylase TrmN6